MAIYGNLFIPFEWILVETFSNLKRIIKKPLNSKRNLTFPVRISIAIFCSSPVLLTKIKNVFVRMRTLWMSTLKCLAAILLSTLLFSIKKDAVKCPHSAIYRKRLFVVFFIFLLYLFMYLFSVLVTVRTDKVSDLNSFCHSWSALRLSQSLSIFTVSCTKCYLYANNVTQAFIFQWRVL